MEHPATESDIVGKTIARILQTEWEHSENFSNCDFYVEFTDGTLIYLGFDGSLCRIDSEDRASIKLHDVEIDSDYPAFWSCDENVGVGSLIEKVLKDTCDDVYLVLSERYYLTPQVEEGSTQLGLLNRKNFLDYARYDEFFDYWTNKPFISDNMRAIDVIVKSSVDDLNLWQSRDLFLTIGHVKDGNVSDRVFVPNKPHGDLWKARFVVPEPGTFQIRVQRRGDDFCSDFQIDESVIVEGLLEVHVI